MRCGFRDARRIFGLGFLSVLAVALLLACPTDQVKADYAGPIYFDQPQLDSAAPNVPTGQEVVTVHVRAVNGESGPLTVDPAHCFLTDENDDQYRERTGSSKPPLEKTVLAPGESLSDYIAFLVPLGTWPEGAGYDGMITMGWLVPVFSDVNDGYHFYKQIGELKYQGIVNGFGDGSFRPDGPILRQQLAKMLVLGRLRLVDDGSVKATGSATLPPVPSPVGSYPLSYLESAAKSGYLPWNEAEGAHALGTITRLELALALAQIGDGVLKPAPSNYQPFSDVPASAAEDVALLEFNGILSGTGPGTFSPTALASRGQAARAIGLMLKPQPTLSSSPGLTTTTGP